MQQDLLFTKQIEEAEREQQEKSLRETQRIEAAKTLSRKDATEAAIGFGIELFNKNSDAGKAFALASIAADTGRALAGALGNANSPTPDNIATGGLAGIAKYISLATTIAANSRKAIKIVKGGSNANIADSNSTSNPGTFVSSSSGNEGLSNVNPSLLSQFNNQAQQSNNITVNSQVSVVDIIEATENRAVKVDESSLG